MIRFTIGNTSILPVWRQLISRGLDKELVLRIRHRRARNAKLGQVGPVLGQFVIKSLRIFPPVAAHPKLAGRDGHPVELDGRSAAHLRRLRGLGRGRLQRRRGLGGRRRLGRLRLAAARLDELLPALLRRLGQLFDQRPQKLLHARIAQGVDRTFHAKQRSRNLAQPLQ